MCDGDAAKDTLHPWDEPKAAKMPRMRLLRRSCHQGISHTDIWTRMDGKSMFQYEQMGLNCQYYAKSSKMTHSIYQTLPLTHYLLTVPKHFK